VTEYAAQVVQISPSFLTRQFDRHQAGWSVLPSKLGIETEFSDSPV
jgi:hypothetical protein